MTKTEAIDKLQDLSNEVYNEDFDGYSYAQAIDMAIESLSADEEKENGTFVNRDNWNFNCNDSNRTLVEPKWIPCSERLPKVGQDVLFCDGKWTEEGCMMEDGDWCQFRWSTFRHKEDVTAWMPLPTPYGERKEE